MVLLLMLPLLPPLSLLSSLSPIALVPATAAVAAEDDDSSSRPPSVDRENTGTSSRGGIDVGWKARVVARRRRIRESLFILLLPTRIVVADTMPTPWFRSRWTSSSAEKGKLGRGPPLPRGATTDSEEGMERLRLLGAFLDRLVRLLRLWQLL